MMPLTREELFRKNFPDEPAFRWKQIGSALFQDGWNSWNNATSLPAGLRQTLAENTPWTSYVDATIVGSGDNETHKAALKLTDGQCIETVLMRNRRGAWTICVSSQVGCAMRCTFCATGRMGLQRNLTADEIVDQYRFWKRHLAEHTEQAGRISNLVFMGMGEPMANYDNVKAAIRTLLERTDVGPTHITVSSVGLLPQLEALLGDQDWPPVRLAISLHSADPVTRREIMPTSYEGFLGRLAAWSNRYLQEKGGRRRHVTFEYLLLAGVNDTPRHAELLTAFVRASGRARVNLIPYNATDSGFTGSDETATQDFLAALERAGIDATRRRSMGTDIAAACGQLILKVKKDSPAADGAAS
ncbi:MAG: 23S rRNA (adenine(2503)-C(2))-methyltransferase RlmN [Patescibacteria group bacterium]|jgi:adenine C2-methylase RlmN of 23S rRNA A2503 and tRNA A37